MRNMSMSEIDDPIRPEVVRVIWEPHKTRDNW